MVRVRPLIVPLFMFALVSGCQDGSETSGTAADAGGDPFAGAAAASSAVNAERIREIVAYLSDDALAGRGPGTEGDRLAREHIAQKLEEFGFQPAGTDGWEQPVTLVGLNAKMPETWSFRRNGNSVSFDWWEEYIGASGVQKPTSKIEDAEVVFVGYGIEAEEENWDDYKGADLEGKVLLMLNNDPDWDPELFAGTKRLYYGRWTYKYEIAAEKGAAGAIIIHTAPSAGYGWNVVQSSWTGTQFELAAGDEPRVELEAWLTRDAARELLEFAGMNLDELIEEARTREFTPVPLGVKTSFSFTTDIESTTTANVLGKLPGSDPELADEYVVYTAHHDHLGVSRPDDTGDAIYNGALDNAAGVAQVLSIAKAFSDLEPAPRRSILMLLVAAEEQGLIGSHYYSRNPTVPPGKIAANINIDGGNIFGRTENVGVIGYGKSDLEDLLVAAAKTQDRTVEEEPFPDKGYYYRSDQLNFARIGVPALYFKSGTNYRGRTPEWGKQKLDTWRAEQYHQPSDELNDSWDLSGLVEDAQLAFYVGAAVARQDELPAWRPGDEFEAERKRALAAAE